MLNADGVLHEARLMRETHLRRRQPLNQQSAGRSRLIITTSSSKMGRGQDIRTLTMRSVSPELGALKIRWLSLPISERLSLWTTPRSRRRISHQQRPRAHAFPRAVRRGTTCCKSIHLRYQRSGKRLSYSTAVTTSEARVYSCLKTQ